MSSAPHAWPFRERDLLALSFNPMIMVDNKRRDSFKSTDYFGDRDCTWFRLTPPRAMRLPVTSNEGLLGHPLFIFGG